MDVRCIVPQKLMQAVGNLGAQKIQMPESRKEKYLFANVENGARLDGQKNPKALYNSAGKLLLSCQAHSQPEQIVYFFVSSLCFGSRLTCTFVPNT